MPEVCYLKYNVVFNIEQSSSMQSYHEALSNFSKIFFNTLFILVKITIIKQSITKVTISPVKKDTIPSKTRVIVYLIVLKSIIIFTPYILNTRYIYLNFTYSKILDIMYSFLFYHNSVFINNF